MHALVQQSVSYMPTIYCGATTETCASFVFFFNDTATTEIYTLSLHDALPISTFTVDDITNKIPKITSPTGGKIVISKTNGGVEEIGRAHV